MCFNAPSVSVSGESTNYVLDVALKARARALGPLHPSFNIVHHLKEGLQRFLPDNAHEICSGRLHVSLTRVSDRKNVLVSQFDSREDLIEVGVVCVCVCVCACSGTNT